jgi:type IV pilus assembly protein PilQ
MTPQSTTLRSGRRLAALALVGFLAAGAASEALAQRVTPPTGRRAVAYVSPDELVSFPASMPFSDFVRLVNPTFLRVTGKAVVDPMDRTDAIGVALNGIHFIDAFELVLARAGLDFRETEHYFIIQDAAAQAVGTDVLNADPGVAAQAAGVGAALPATAETREVRIDAVIFEANLNRFRETGTNWAALFGQAGGSGSGGSGGSGGGSGSGDQNAVEIPKVYIEGGSFFDALDGFITVSSDRVDLAFLLRLFRWFETEGYGETIASPSVTVQSGEQGRMQSGSDIPIQIQDFQGNTITQFVSTGVIIDVTPTLIADPDVGNPVEFVHLDVKVEKSSGQPSGAGIQINKNDVNTQVLLLDGEQTVIGGLYSTEESFFRKGIPILKDIPLIKYLFSYRTRNVLHKELVVVLQARVVDSIVDRSGRPLRDNLYQEDQQIRRSTLDRFRPGAGREAVLPTDHREAFGLPETSEGADR